MDGGKEHCEYSTHASIAAAEVSSNMPRLFAWFSCIFDPFFAQL